MLRLNTRIERFTTRKWSYKQFENYTSSLKLSTETSFFLVLKFETIRNEKLIILLRSFFKSKVLEKEFSKILIPFSFFFNLLKF